MANNLIKVIVAGVQVVGRAFTRAIRKEFAASQQAAEKAGGGEKGTKSAVATGFHGISLDEAKKILNIDNIQDSENVIKSYDHLMKVNDKSEGGSFYLQSKVFRAKERIDAELGHENETKSEPKSDSETKT
ncbi:mitochondrial import inner membrane translocase subunit tim16-B-like [Styela clava]|uniref:mitochondrial import inner membrane translocase subunit tim16-B-like n=1 Tax=Styela clava TaxID=7725 RepID=UPI00193ABCF2|nr:mitochondrial import inner membrane translocase subunit tim16-B-like [Styela clava]